MAGGYLGATDPTQTAFCGPFAAFTHLLCSPLCSSMVTQTKTTPLAFLFPYLLRLSITTSLAGIAFILLLFICTIAMGVWLGVIGKEMRGCL